MFWLFWLVASVLMLALEIVTANALVSIWFSFGGLFAMVLALLNFGIEVQIISFGFASLVFFVLFRPMLEKFLFRRNVATNYDRYIGRRYKLLKEISDDAGTIKINDLYWSCISNDNKPIEKDSEVEILAFEGSKIIVRRI